MTVTFIDSYLYLLHTSETGSRNSGTPYHQFARVVTTSKNYSSVAKLRHPVAKINHSKWLHEHHFLHLPQPCV